MHTQVHSNIKCIVQLKCSMQLKRDRHSNCFLWHCEITCMHFKSVKVITYYISIKYVSLRQYKLLAYLSHNSRQSSQNETFVEMKENLSTFCSSKTPLKTKQPQIKQHSVEPIPLPSHILSWWRHAFYQMPSKLYQFILDLSPIIQQNFMPSHS